MNRQPVLSVRLISKSFSGIKVLDHVDFDLFPGEVHIIAGENGAGKSTLIKCILGIYPADEGEIIYQGDKVSFSDILKRQKYEEEIAAVHQELTLIPHLDPAQNIYFGREPLVGHTPLINDKKMYGDAKKIMEEIHCGHIPLKSPVKNLGVANQQMIEIAKALSRHSRVLIFDEPTSSLSMREVDFLLEQIDYLKKQGIAIIYISHRMDEFSKIGDRITILRDGKKILTSDIDQISQSEITKAMIGREIHLAQDKEATRKTSQAGTWQKEKPILLVEDVSDYNGKVNHCSLSIDAGEIVGISGLVGSGRTELSRLIYGIDPIKEGKIIFKDMNVTGTRPEQMVAYGMGYLPENRKTQGLALQASIAWNTMASSLKKYFPGKILSRSMEIQTTRNIGNQLHISPNDPGKASGELSGGNQQKVVLAKWMAADTDFIIFDEPTKGVDIGAKLEIYQLIQKLAEEGKGILVISSEMEEIIHLCHRTYIMADGRIKGQLREDQITPDMLGSMMFDTDSNSYYEKEPRTDSQPIRNKQPKAKQFNIKLPLVFYLMIACILFFGIKADNYLSISNLSSILNQAAPLLAVACGQTLIVLTQGTDLSLGSLMTLTGVFWFFLLNMGLPIYITIPVCLLLGIVLGAVNGLISGKLWIPVFIVTLGTQNIFKSASLLLCNNNTLYYSSPFFRIIGKGKFLGLTWSFWIAMICFLITLFFMKKTRFGHVVKGLGGNIEALKYMGTNILSSQIKVFAYAGLMAAVGGLLLACRIESGNPNAGNGFEFSAIAAVLYGGTSMREGRGGVEGTILGVLFIQILKSGLMQAGVSSVYQNFIMGIILILALVLDIMKKKKEEREDVS